MSRRVQRARRPKSWPGCVTRVEARRHRSTTQPVADAAHRLQEHRVGRIDLDLAAQAVDLHVDRALVGAGAAAGEILAGDVAAGAVAEDGQDLALALGDADDVLVAAQLAAVEAIDERPEADRLGAAGAAVGWIREARLRMLLSRRMQLARLEGFRQVVVGADLEAVTRSAGSARAVSIRIGTCESLRTRRA